MLRNNDEPSLAVFSLFFQAVLLVSFFGCGYNPVGEQTDSGPYATMRPSGRALGEILGLANHMSTRAAYSREREFEIEQSSAAGIRYVRRGFYWPQIEPNASGQWILFDQEGREVTSGRLGGGLLAATLSGRVQYLQFTVNPAPRIRL